MHACVGAAGAIGVVVVAAAGAPCAYHISILLSPFTCTFVETTTLARSSPKGTACTLTIGITTNNSEANNDAHVHHCTPHSPPALSNLLSRNKTRAIFVLSLPHAALITRPYVACKPLASASTSLTVHALPSRVLLLLHHDDTERQYAAAASTPNGVATHAQALDAGRGTNP